MPAITFKPDHLLIGEPVVFGQRYNYAIDHPIEQMLGQGYFNPARNRLRAGDTIRILQLQSPSTTDPENRVLAYADILVTSASSEGGVEFVVERPAVSVQEKKTDTPKRGRPRKETYVSGDAEVKKDGSKYKVMVGAKEVAVLPDYQQALDIASGTTPLPDNPA